MSASGYKRTLWGGALGVRFTPESRHSDAHERAGLQKRTFSVCFTPKSGRNRVWRGMSVLTLSRHSGNPAIRNPSVIRTASESFRKVCPRI